MSIGLFLFLLVGMSVASLVIGSRASKGMAGAGDYLLAGRRLGAFSLALSVMATQIGAGVVLGSAEAAYRSGWSVLLWPWGNALGLLVLGLGLGGRLRKLGISSVPELFESIYGSRRLRQVAAVLSVSALFFILVAQLIGLRKFLYATGLGGTALYLGVGAVVLIYTALGGLRAVVFTDVLQALFIGVIFAVTAGVVAPQGLPPVSADLLDGGVVSSLSSWFIAPFLFMIIGQDMGQRCFSGNSGRSVNRAFRWGALGVAAVGFVPVWLGVLAARSGVPVEGTSVLMVATEAFGGPWILSAVAVGVVVALLSTIDSLVCAVGSNLALDFGIGLKRIRALQVSSLIVGLTALGMGLLFNDVGAVLITSYELAVSCLAVPVLASLIPRIRSTSGATLSILAGGLGFVLLRCLSWEVPRELCGLGLSIVGYSCGWALSAVRKRRHQRA